MIYKPYFLIAVMWSLRENEKELLPLKFSNGKTQEDIVREVFESIKNGNKLVFIKGVCGTGKSAITLNIAKELGKTCIVVPIKNLQKQYEDDYTRKKQIFKKNGQKLKIRVIKGRQNFQCCFLKENSIKQEKNSTLDIFGSPKEMSKNESCDNSILPCKIEIKEKNYGLIKNYLKQNPKVNSYLELKFVRRMSIAPICPYWSPIISSELNLGLDGEKKQYKGLRNINFTIYNRKQGCEYYNQYLSYLNSDVLIFNSHKYKLETLMNRKPATEVEIIDECDEFLDSFSNSSLINLNRLHYALGYLFSDNNETNQEINKLNNLVVEIANSNNKEEVVPIKETKIIDILKIFLEKEIMNNVECDEENYCYHVDEVAREFENLLDESYVLFEKTERALIANIVAVDIAKKFKEMLDKNKAFVLMSGTIHSEKVLKEIFKLHEFKIIEAETQMPGKITKLKTGMEISCNYQNLKNNGMRKKYLKALERCIELAKKPVLVHVNSFYDLPNEREKEKFELNILTREKLVEMQKDKELISQFKNKEISILYSTKCTRGVDFPGEMCNSIIITKYPYPDVKGIFWQLLKKTKPQYYSSFYLDKAKREFLQRIYRGLRFNEDHIYLLSPDARVMSGI